MDLPEPVIWQVTEPARVVVAPFTALFSVRSDGSAFLHALLASAWTALVWGILGGAIARIAIVEVARSERMALGQTLRFVSRKLVPLVGGPLVPLLGVTIFATLCAGFGILYRLPGPVGPALGGIFLFLPLLAGLIMALILAGLAVGWPLIHASVAAEADDGFDALSRTYAYVHQRPALYAAYVALTWLIGVVGFLFVRVFATLVVHLAHWALTFTAPQDLLAALLGGSAHTDHPTAALLHSFWLSLVNLLVHSWIYSFFWTSAAIIYLLLRRDVDGTPYSEVALPPREEPPPALDATSESSESQETVATPE